MMKNESIILEKEQSVATITLNRPNVLNAMNRDMITRLEKALENVETDPDIGAVILQGNGRAFSAGFDLKEEAEDVVEGPSEWFPRFRGDWDIFLKVWHMNKPVVAAVHGYCLGGVMELILLCDLAIAAEETKFGFPEIRFASGPGMGILAYAIGSIKRVKEIMLLGDQFGADEAEYLGVVNLVVPKEALYDVAFDTARRLALIPRETMRSTKEFINSIYEQKGLIQSTDYGTALCALMTDSKEYKEEEGARVSLGKENIKEFFTERQIRFKSKYRVR